MVEQVPMSFLCVEDVLHDAVIERDGPDVLIMLEK